MARMGPNPDLNHIPLHHAQSKILPPVTIRWPKVFHKPQTWKNRDRCKEWSCEPPATSPDSRTDANTGEARSSLLGEDAENPCDDPGHVDVDAYFDPRHVGSYPLKPPHMLLSLGIKALNGSGLEVLEEDNDANAQPEKDMETLGKIRSKRATTFVLPLDLFHNQELELCHPSLDIDMAHDKKERGVPGRSCFYSSKGQCSWEPCLVLSYNKDTSKDFEIEWVKSGKKKIVKRLNLILDREKESSFISMVLNAKNLRNLVRVHMRCYQYIEELPFENAELVDKALQTRIINLAGVCLCKRYPDLVNDYMECLKAEYHRSIKKSILDHQYFVTKENFSRLSALQIFPYDSPKPPIPSQGCVPVDFGFDNAMQSRKNTISKNLCVAEEAFLLALLRFHKEMDITDIFLFNPQLFTLPRPLKLEDFRSIQEGYLREMADNFRNDWIPRVVAMVDELAPPTTEFSGASLEKLRGFVRRLSLTMTQQLLDVLVQSMDMYKKLWEQYSEIQQSNSLNNGEYSEGLNEDKSSSANTLPITDTETLHLMPMFNIKLKVEGEHFIFEPTLSLIESTVLLLLDSILSAVKGIEDLQSRVTTISTIYQFKVMKSLDSDDTRFLTIRKTIQHFRNS